MDTRDVRWVPHPTDAFCPAEIFQTGQYQYKVKPLPGHGSEYTLNLQYNDPQPQTYLQVHNSALVPHDDLLSLSQIVEPAMLHQLRLRFREDMIYTWISSILVSVNPFKSIKDLYTIDKMNETMKMARNYESQMPAHLFSTAASAYQQLTTSTGKTSISVIISGESGSGKTLCNNLFLQFFSVMSDKPIDSSSQADNRPQSPSSPSSPSSPVSPGSYIVPQSTSQQIISSAVILEAFGNAKTVRNNNSSRFGKYIRLYFSPTTQQLSGASFESYLLEKSRITTAITDERNYHIFYQLLAGLDPQTRELLSITSETNQFTILRGSQVHSVVNQPGAEGYDENSRKLLDIVGFDDKADFEKTVEALVHHFDSHTLNHIWRVLAGIMHLGNIEFEENKAVLHDGCKLTDHSEQKIIPKVSELLGLDKDILIQSLLSQKLQVGKDIVMKKKNLNDARGNLQSLLRTIYDTQFSWLILEINKSLSPTIEQTKLMSTIGLLDIFGFEDFQINSYEQLLINYTNEALQRFFNSCVFEIELTEYRIENLDINLNSITYTNNQPCLDLIENGPTCIIEMIDDELKLPRGNDLTFLEKLDKKHEFNQYYTRTRTKAPVFTITHYAAKVTYNVEGWLIKSKDDLQLDLAHCLTLSTIPHLRLIMNDFYTTRKGPQRSLGFKFRLQVHDLVKMLFDSSPYFIRCIKSNHELSGGKFDSQLILSQMKYLGLMSLVKIREVGYPLRLDYTSFLLRYSLLQLDNDKSNHVLSSTQLKGLDIEGQKKITKIILTRTDKTGENWKLGKTKVFYRSQIQSILERMRADEMEQRLQYLQGYIKTNLEQRRYTMIMSTIIDIEQFLQLYSDKCSNMLLNEVLPQTILPHFTPLINRANQCKFNPDPSSTKRGNQALLKLLQLQQRLSEQDDAISFLQRAILANNKETLLAAMNEIQTAFLIPYYIPRDGPSSPQPKYPKEVDLDQFETQVANLFHTALQLWEELCQFEHLWEKTKVERTLELAHNLTTTAKRLGIDKSTQLEIQQLCNIIADEVAKKELERRKKEAEEERIRKEKESEEERIRQEEEEEEKERLEEEARLLKLQQEEDEAEQQRLIVAAAANAAIAASAEELLQRQLQMKKEDEERLALFKADAEPPTTTTPSTPTTTTTTTTTSPPTTPVLQRPALILRPSSPVSPGKPGYQQHRPKPDYNKISHFILTSNSKQLSHYLSQFPIINTNYNHLTDLPTSPLSLNDRLYQLQLNTLHYDSNKYDIIDFKQQQQQQQQRKDQILTPSTLTQTPSTTTTTTTTKSPSSSSSPTSPYTQYTPIFEAVQRGDQATIKVLIDYGANINALNSLGQSPLYCAIQSGKFETALYLITTHNAAVSRFDGIPDGDQNYPHPSHHPQQQQQQQQQPPSTPTSSQDSNQQQQNTQIYLDGGCIGHLLAATMTNLFSKFSIAKTAGYIQLLEAILDKNEQVIYFVPNRSKHTAIQHFRKLIKTGQQQLVQQIKSLKQERLDVNNPSSQQSLSQHGVKQKVSLDKAEKEIQKCKETLTFLEQVKIALFSAKPQ